MGKIEQIDKEVSNMETWKLTDIQLAKIRDCASNINKQNPDLKMTLVVADGVLLGVSVRFLPPEFWLADTPKNAQIEKTIHEEIEKRSCRCLFPEKSELFRRGILELKYTSIHCAADESYVIEAMKFIADDLIDVILGKKELS